MKKHLKIRKDERLYEWCDRLAEYICSGEQDPKEVREILGELSKHSYLHGHRDAINVLIKP